MPLYEYQCDDCGNRFERIRKFSDPPLDEPCARCGGPIRKLISSPAIQFKGKGWYVTDYAKSGAAEPSGTESGSEASADKKEKPASEGKSETPSPAVDKKEKKEAKAESKTTAGKPATAPAKSE